MSNLSSIGLLLGRILLSCIFILSGIGKFMDFHGSAEYMAAKGMTMVPFFLIIAALIEILGGLSLLLGWKARYGAGILFLYLIPVTLIFHDFWGGDASQQQAQLIEFLKNLAIMGGLLSLASIGGGKLAVDSCCGCRTKY